MKNDGAIHHKPLTNLETFLLACMGKIGHVKSFGLETTSLKQSRSSRRKAWSTWGWVNDNQKWGLGNSENYDAEDFYGLWNDAFFQPPCFLSSLQQLRRYIVHTCMELEDIFKKWWFFFEYSRFQQVTIFFFSVFFCLSVRGEIYKSGLALGVTAVVSKMVDGRSPILACQLYAIWKIYVSPLIIFSALRFLSLHPMS